MAALAGLREEARTRQQNGDLQRLVLAWTIAGAAIAAPAPARTLRRSINPDVFVTLVLPVGAVIPVAAAPLQMRLARATL